MKRLSAINGKKFESIMDGFTAGACYVVTLETVEVHIQILILPLPFHNYSLKGVLFQC